MGAEHNDNDDIEGFLQIRSGTVNEIILMMITLS